MSEEQNDLSSPYSILAGCLIAFLLFGIIVGGIGFLVWQWATSGPTVADGPTTTIAIKGPGTNLKIEPFPDKLQFTHQIAWGSQESTVQLVGDTVLEDINPPAGFRSVEIRMLFKSVPGETNVVIPPANWKTFTIMPDGSIQTRPAEPFPVSGQTWMNALFRTEQPTIYGILKVK